MSTQRAPANAEMEAPRSFQTCLDSARGNINSPGNVFTVFPRRTPTRILGGERRRMDVPHWGGRAFRQSDTNEDRLDMSRCCLSGFEGAILNAAEICQVFSPRYFALRDVPDLVSVFHLDRGRGRGIVYSPPGGIWWPPSQLSHARIWESCWATAAPPCRT